MRQFRMKYIFKRQRNRNDVRCLKRIQLIISGCLTMIVGIFTIVYTMQQSQLAEQNSLKETLAAEILHEQVIFEDYLNDMLENVFRLSKCNCSECGLNSDRFKQHIRIKTLNALTQINLDQKKRLLFFLYDNKLIHSNCPSRLIDLTGADFSYLQLSNERDCNLCNISLRNIVANSIEFINCDLSYSDFSGSNLIGAKFKNSRTGRSIFMNTNLTNSIFLDTNIVGLWLNNSILINTKFSRPPLDMKLYNTDLLASSWSSEQIIHFSFDEQFNSVYNTRLSDGTFSQIDSKQLVFDEGAELGCEKEIGNVLLSESRPNWYQSPLHSKVHLINTTKMNNINISSYEGDCCFQCYFTNSRFLQLIDISNYSLLIQQQKVSVRFSFFVVCPFSIELSYYTVGFYSSKLSIEGKIYSYQIITNKTTNTNQFQQIIFKELIPKNTKYIDIELGGLQGDSFLQQYYCLFDNIHVNLF